jgi:hypothetical protein
MFNLLSGVAFACSRLNRCSKKGGTHDVALELTLSFFYGRRLNGSPEPFN